jgi:hypothetical protein
MGTNLKSQSAARLLMSLKLSRGVLLSSFLLIGVTSFLIFVPVVHEEYLVPCFSPCGSAFLTYNYTASISYHYSNYGAVSGVCGGYQVVLKSPNGVQTPNLGWPACITFG